MIEIHNLKELNKLGKNLKYNDHIYFEIYNKIIKYKVIYHPLVNLNGFNDEIFNVLEIRNKSKFAKKSYGYNSKNSKIYYHQWPKSKASDYPALTRLVKELYKLLENKKAEYKPIYSRFEILDL